MEVSEVERLNNCLQNLDLSHKIQKSDGETVAEWNSKHHLVGERLIMLESILRQMNTNKMDFGETKAIDSCDVIMVHRFVSKLLSRSIIQREHIEVVAKIYACYNENHNLDEEDDYE